jgi:hypothetical protein
MQQPAISRNTDMKKGKLFFERKCTFLSHQCLMALKKGLKNTFDQNYFVPGKKNIFFQPKKIVAKKAVNFVATGVSSHLFLKRKWISLFLEHYLLTHFFSNFKNTTNEANEIKKNEHIKND